MKLIRAFSIVLCVTVVVAGGCSRPLDKHTDPVTVSIEGGGKFPDVLAGRWKADQDGWEFLFEPDGRIASAVISLGCVTVVPGQATTTPTLSGGHAVFTPGPWVVHYDPTTSILTVKIAMERVRVPMGINLLEGSSTDTFSGPISAATGTWQAEWTTFTHYTARTGENTPVDLSTDQTYGESKLLVFTKMSE
jgi:hypothetical protein